MSCHASRRRHPAAGWDGNDDPTAARYILRNLCSDRRLSGLGWSLNVCGQFVQDTSPT
jgi:hypothetical protein